MKSKVKRSNLNICPLTIWCAIKTGIYYTLLMNEINILNGKFVIRQTMISNQIKEKDDSRVSGEQKAQNVFS